jgi:hypothetical protein
MNIDDLTVNQLKRAVAIRERIEVLNRQLRSILGESSNSTSASTNSRGMSASVRRKIAAAQRARWARLRRSKSASGSAQRGAKAKKKTMSAAARRRLSVKLKAYWAAKKKTTKR